jgi:hypothetical protein
VKTIALKIGSLPRFNMPLELGVFLGAKRFGTGGQKGKACIVFDREPYRFQRFISDIAGQDIRTHGGDVPTLIRELAAWLRTQPGGLQAGGLYRSPGAPLRNQRTPRRWPAHLRLVGRQAGYAATRRVRGLGSVRRRRD